MKIGPEFNRLLAAAVCSIALAFAIYVASLWLACRIVKCARPGIWHSTGIVIGQFLAIVAVLAILAIGMSLARLDSGPSWLIAGQLSLTLCAAAAVVQALAPASFARALLTTLAEIVLATPACVVVVMATHAIVG